MNARRVFLKWSAAVFVVLLPFLAYSTWDAVEAARLQSRMRSVTLPSVPAATPDEAKAARYYEAAAALHTWDQVDPASMAVRNGTYRALRTGAGWTPPYIADARRRVDRNREALGFVDRASELPFTGLGPGTSYSLRTGALMQLGTVCEFRAAVLASDGDAAGAMASLYSEARLSRAIYSELNSPWTTGFPSSRTIAYVLEQTRPSSSAAAALSAALAEVDRDDTMKMLLIRLRASVLRDSSTSRLATWMPYALATHNMVYALDTFSRLLAASEQPWPQRLASAKAIGVWPASTMWARMGRGRTMLDGYLDAIGEQTKRIRCARLTLDGSLNLIDPLTGRRLEMLDCHL